MKSDRWDANVQQRAVRRKFSDDEWNLLQQALIVLVWIHQNPKDGGPQYRAFSRRCKGWYECETPLEMALFRSVGGQLGVRVTVRSTATSLALSVVADSIASGFGSAAAGVAHGAGLTATGAKVVATQAGELASDALDDGSDEASERLARSRAARFVQRAHQRYGSALDLTGLVNACGEIVGDRLLPADADQFWDSLFSFFRGIVTATGGGDVQPFEYTINGILRDVAGYRARTPPESWSKSCYGYLRMLHGAEWGTSLRVGRSQEEVNALLARALREQAERGNTSAREGLDT